MGRKCRYEDGAMTSSEKSRLRSDRFSQIDNQMNEAMAKINWKRRREAESDIVKWVNTYALDSLLEDAPPEKGNEILRKMQAALVSHQNYLICMGRGQGKSCYILLAALFSIVKSLQKFILIVSNNQRAATNLLNDIWRIISETDTKFSKDYPDVCLPFQLCNGSFRRRQYYNGKPTNIVRNAGNLVFARLEDKDGKPYPASEAAIATRGYTSGLRGLRHGKQRVSSVILDDIQDSASACNPEQVQKIVDIVNKDIMPMGGKERLSILQSATPICVDDVVEHFKNDTNWITQTYPVIISYPKHMELWDQYFKLFDAENVTEESHEKSLKFYKDNFDIMNEGSEVFNPQRYSKKDGHISAIQKMLEFRHIIGESAFQCECQMSPVKMSFSIDIEPKDIVAKMTEDNEGVVPTGYVQTVASSDLNLSYCISTTIVGFKPDMSAHIIKHIFRKCNIDGKAPEVEYNQKVYDLLAQHGQEIASLGIHIDGWAIDCNGVPFNAVTLFAKSSMKLCGLRACGFIGKASNMFNGQVKSRIRNQIGRTVLCGDPEEHVKSGAGRRYVFWDSDFYRETVQKAFLSQIGNVGSLTIYKGTIDEHTDYARQICAEKLKFIRHRADGRDEYFWKSSSDHDMLDSTAQAYACAAQFGISSGNFVNGRQVVGRPHKKKLRVKIM